MDDRAHSRLRQSSNFCFGSWKGNTKSHVAHQNPFVSATDLQYQTRSERNSYAAYTQGVYTFNEHFALTLGARWARDQLTGEENTAYYNERYRQRGYGLRVSRVPAGGAIGRSGGRHTAWLCGVNQGSDTSRRTARSLNPQRLLVNGIPGSYQSVAAGRAQG